GRNHYLDGFAIVHCAVPVGNAVKLDSTIEDSSGLDFAFKSVRQQLLDISPHWRNPAADHHIVVKCWLGPWNRLLLRNAYPPHRATRTSNADCGVHGLFKANAFQHRVNALVTG